VLFIIWSWISETICIKALSTLVESNAEVSTCYIFSNYAYYSDSFSGTRLYSSARSLLLPTKSITIPGGPFYLNSYIHVSTFLKLFRFVMS
jgi:hypothetical protein